MENSILLFCRKVEARLLYTTSRYIVKRTEISAKQNLYLDVLCSTIHSSCDTEIIKMPVTGKMEKRKQKTQRKTS
jgi:hypothetical protein